MIASGSVWAEGAGVDGYSRLVSILKVVLPLAALGLLSTLFLLSRDTGSDAVLPFTQTEVEGRLRDEQITGPFFSGMTANGDDIFVSAAIARPGDGNTGPELEEMSGRILFARGGELWMTAQTGTIRDQSETVVFRGDVHLETASGYDLYTQTLAAALNRIEADAPGQVIGKGPIGDITAGSMALRANLEGKNVHLLFKNGVKLVYDPKQNER